MFDIRLCIVLHLGNDALQDRQSHYGRLEIRKNEETCLDAFEIKGLREIPRLSWTAKKLNEWVLNKAGVKRELLDTVRARKLTYRGHIMRKQGSCLEK